MNISRKRQGIAVGSGQKTLDFRIPRCIRAGDIEKPETKNATLKSEMQIRTKRRKGQSLIRRQIILQPLLRQRIEEPVLFAQKIRRPHELPHSRGKTVSAAGKRRQNRASDFVPLNSLVCVRRILTPAESPRPQPFTEFVTRHIEKRTDNAEFLPALMLRR